MDARERAERFCYGNTSDSCEVSRTGSACVNCVEKAIREAEREARAEALEEAARAVESALSFHSYAGATAAAIIRDLAKGELRHVHDGSGKCRRCGKAARTENDTWIYDGFCPGASSPETAPPSGSNEKCGCGHVTWVPQGEPTPIRCTACKGAQP